MKTCPQCGATYADQDDFCAIDGAALPSDAPESGSFAAEGKPRAICVACGAEDADDGEGYCATCGHRLGGGGAGPAIPEKTAVGVWSVGGARGADDFDAQDATGRSVLLAVGADDALAAEGRALEALGAEGALPRVLERGYDPRWGAFLALSAPPSDARRLADVAPSMTISEALTILRSALDLASRIERAGYDWLPLRDDLYLDAKGALVLARLRGAHRLTPSERIDGRAVTEAVGGAFLPEPTVLGTSRLVRFFSAHLLFEGDRLTTIEAERGELEAIAAEGAPKDASGPIAVVCDPGMKRPYNEDAGAAATGEHAGERWAVLVVCDGVSSSMHAEKASAIASKTACETLTHFAKIGDMTQEAATHAVATAVRAAHIAICAQRFEHAGAEPPGTTIVAALVFRGKITVGWVGDSRAYWLAEGGGELLTHDHSWVNETVARGDMSEAEAIRQPLAHALTRCLGPLEVGDGLELVEPDVRTRELEGPGLVVLCSDGLWNYFPAARDLAELIASRGRTSSTLARILVNHALERGGHDNVTVAVYAHE